VRTPLTLIHSCGNRLARLGNEDAIEELTTGPVAVTGTYARAEAGVRIDLVAALLVRGERRTAEEHLRAAHVLASRTGSLRQKRLGGPSVGQAIPPVDRAASPLVALFASQRPLLYGLVVLFDAGHLQKEFVKGTSTPYPVSPGGTARFRPAAPTADHLRHGSAAPYLRRRDAGRVDAGGNRDPPVHSGL
jgi:hypothetical protein